VEESGIYIRPTGVFDNDPLPSGFFWTFYWVVPTPESLVGKTVQEMTDDEADDFGELLGDHTTVVQGPAFKTAEQAVTFAAARAQIVVIQADDGSEFSAGAQPAQSGAMPPWRISSSR
jgi:hypothetical protein